MTQVEKTCAKRWGNLNGEYSNGAVISSPIYIGYNYNGAVYRMGLDLPASQDFLQNGIHTLYNLLASPMNWQTIPYWHTPYDRSAAPYFNYSNYNPFSIYN